MHLGAAGVLLMLIMSTDLPRNGTECGAKAYGLGGQ